MRLVCPNCAAQYEVDASAIPDTGRDVQCANCGKTWFQGPETNEDSAPEPQEEAAPEPPQVDQAVLDILREEAENSRRAENAETEAAHQEVAADPEPEPVDEPEPVEDSENQSLAERARAARANLKAGRNRDRRAALASEEGNERYETVSPAYPEVEEQPPEDDFVPAPKRRPARGDARDLPNVDELNSTLRSADDTSRDKEQRQSETPKAQSGRGNTFGFYLAVLLVLVLLAVYALKQQIIAAMPDAAPYLDQYTDMIDVARHRLATGMDALVKAVAELLGQFL